MFECIQYRDVGIACAPDTNLLSKVFASLRVRLKIYRLSYRLIPHAWLSAKLIGREKAPNGSKGHCLEIVLNEDVSSG